jgi:hypothetical protein
MVVGMIGDFRWAMVNGDPRVIYVDLLWVGDERCARIQLAPDCRQAFALAAYPDIAPEPIGLPSALSYGMFLAMTAGLSLRLTGDVSVWDEAWGSLEPDVEAAPELMTARWPV